MENLLAYRASLHTQIYLTHIKENNLKVNFSTNAKKMTNQEKFGGTYATDIPCSPWKWEFDETIESILLYFYNRKSFENMFVLKIVNLNGLKMHTFIPGRPSKPGIPLSPVNNLNVLDLIDEIWISLNVWYFIIYCIYLFHLWVRARLPFEKYDWKKQII